MRDLSRWRTPFEVDSGAEHAKRGVRVNSVVQIATFAMLAGVTAGAAQARSPRYDGPQPLSAVVPAYPPLFVMTCTQGTASVVVELAQDGTVSSADFISGPVPLEQVTVDAAKAWTFEPVATADRRRQVLRFSFTIVPRRAPKSEATSFRRTPTDVEVRSYPLANAVTCNDCGVEAIRRSQRAYERACAG